MPAAPIALGDVVQVIIGSTAFGQQALNVVYYRATGNMGPHTSDRAVSLDVGTASDSALSISAVTRGCQ